MTLRHFLQCVNFKIDVALIDQSQSRDLITYTELHGEITEIYRENILETTV